MSVHKDFGGYGRDPRRGSGSRSPLFGLALFATIALLAVWILASVCGAR